MLLELLPLLDGWKDIGVDISKPKVISKGNQMIVDEVNYPGWLYSLEATIQGDPEAVFIIEWYDPMKGPQKTYISPANLLELGLDEPNTAAPYISYWDDSIYRYTVVFTPAVPLPFRADSKNPRRLILQAVANNVVLLEYSQAGFAIYDKDAFIRSLRRIIANTSVEEKVREEAAKLLGGSHGSL